MIAGAFALLKQLFHVFKIMTGDQNPGVVAHAQIHRCDFGIAVAGGIGLIKQGHGGDCDLTTLEDLTEHLVNTQVAGCRGQGGHHEIVEFRLLKPKHGSMIGVCSHSFKTIDQQFAQGTYIFVGLGQYADFGGLGSVIALRTVPVDRIKIAAVTDGRFQGIALGNRCLDQANEAGIIKVGVGNGGKKALADEQSSGRIQLVLFLGFFGDNRLSFQGIDQQIL